jgi:hypothetical protein
LHKLAKTNIDPTELKIALDNRAFEIQLFWQRSNYFLVLITALGIGVFSIKDPIFSLLIAIAATTSSYFWFRTNLGSRFWQESWEAEVILLAHELGIRSFQRPMSEIVAQVDKELSGGNNKGKFRGWIDRKILEKPSVSYHMIKLSIASMFLWGVVSFVFLLRAKDGLHKAFSRLTDFVCSVSDTMNFIICSAGF